MKSWLNCSNQTPPPFADLIPILLAVPRRSFSFAQPTWLAYLKIIMMGYNPPHPPPLVIEHIVPVSCELWPPDIEHIVLVSCEPGPRTFNILYQSVTSLAPGHWTYCTGQLMFGHWTLNILYWSVVSPARGHSTYCTSHLRAWLPDIEHIVQGSWCLATGHWTFCTGQLWAWPPDI